MTSELYKNIPPSAKAENVWQGKRYLISCLSSFLRKK